MLKIEQAKAHVARINRGLVRVKIQLRGSRLVLRGYFPPHPTRESSEARATLNPDIIASEAGIRAIEAIAKEIDGQLMLGRFVWDPWLRASERGGETIGAVIAKVEAAHWQTKPKDPDSLYNWKKSYGLFYRKLPADARISLEMLKDLILENSEAGTRTRKGWAQALAKLADAAGLSGSTLRKLSTYTAQKVQPQTLPSDEEILEGYLSITDPKWRTVYMLMAVWGLRDHECWRCDLSRLVEDPPVVEVQARSKTRERLVYPCMSPLWVKDMDPCGPLPMPIYPETLANGAIGGKVSAGFAAFGLKGLIGRPYNLRHSYARRTLVNKWPVEMAARCMGHSVKVHIETYQRFITESYYAEIYRDLHPSSGAQEGSLDSSPIPED